MTSLKQEWMSIDDYCKHAFLGYDVTMTKRDGKMVKKVDTKGASKGEISIRRCRDVARNFKGAGGEL